VEIVNYPALQSAKVRQHVLNKGECDAVLLVYDVSDRRSFDRVRELHAEVSLVDSNGSNHHKRQRSHAPRRHSGTPTGSSMQRRNSVMSFFSPGGGLVGPEEDVEAGKGSGGGVVIALVGNKADIGDGDCDLTEKTAEEDELLEQDDDFDDDCESALAVFGDAMHREQHDEFKLGATLGITGRPKPSHAESSETVERWLQVVGKAVEEDKEPAALEPASLEAPVSKAKPGRSIPKSEGEDLARSLELQVPFFETSARTGANVEEAFEAVVRSVLKKMGRSATPSTEELAKRCRQKHEAEQQKRASVSRSSRSVDRLTHGAGLVRGAGNHGHLVLETKLDGQGHAAHLERPASVQNAPGRESIPRRESFMDRMRRILTSEEARGGEGPRGSAESHPTRSL
jgi:GTPase SAR1 family protein